MKGMILENVLLHSACKYFLSNFSPGVVAHVFNSNTLEAEAG